MPRINNLIGAPLTFVCLIGVGALWARADDGKKSSSEKGFAPIFDGETLKGWSAYPAGTADDWSVREGAIAGIGAANRLSYLVWRDTKLTDFELRLSYRMLTKGNTGIEIRARKDKTGKRPFEGYHADLGHIGIGKNILGAWDFHFATRKEHPCPRGTTLLIGEDESARHATIEQGALSLKDIRKRDWNEVRILARGNSFQFHINGKLASAFTDNAKKGQLTSGAIALQLHDKGMHVEFKDLRLRRLPSRKSAKRER